MRLCNILKLLPHILLVKSAKKANKQTKNLLNIQSKSAFDLTLKWLGGGQFEPPRKNYPQKALPY